VEVAPGYVRLRPQLGLRTKFGRRHLGPLVMQVVRQLEDLKEAGESIEFERLDPDEEAAILAAEEDRASLEPRSLLGQPQQRGGSGVLRGQGA